MTYPDDIRKRAIELRNKGLPYKAILKTIRNEFKERDEKVVLDSLDEKTIYRWKKGNSERLIEPSIPVTKEQKIIPSNSKEDFREHNIKLKEVAKSLLDNDLASVSHGWTRKKVVGQAKYIVTKENKVGEYYGLTDEQLSDKLKENIVLTEHKHLRWFVHDCFLQHLQSELPEELKDNGFFDIVKEKPYELIKILRALLERDKFPGKCSYCEGQQ